MPTSTLSTLKTKRVGFADPLTSSPGRSNTNTNTHKDATEDKEKRNVDAKDSVTYKGMPLSATELLHALHSSIVDEILSDEVSRHSTPFEDYSHSPDWSQRQTEQGLSSPDWEMGDPIIPQPWLAASTADESMSESDSDSEPGFASALQSQTQTQVPANNSTSVMEVEFTEVAEKSAPCAAIESIDLVKSPTPEPQPYFDAREHTASQSLAAAAEDSCSEFEFDSDCEDDYHQFPSVSREPVRNLGFELCAAEFMRKGVYPVKRMEKRAFVDYASQKAMEIGMTEEEFARMMRALRGVYLLQWGEKMRKDSEGISTEKSDANPVHGPEVSQVEPVGRRRKESELMSAESGAVQPDVTPGTLQPVLIEESEAESAENSKVTAADGSQKDSATPLDQVALDPPSISASASNLDAASPPKTPVKHEPTQMSTMQTDQEEKANDKGTRIKADKKTKAPVDNSSANEKKRKHDGSPIILDQDQQANTVLTQKRKQRKKARLSSESHPSSDPVVKLSVQSSETARQQNKLPNKTTKDMPGNTSIQNSASQGKQANELAKAGGLGCAKHFTTEPLRDAKNLEKSQQLKEGTTPAKSVLPRNATKGDNLKKPAGPKPMEASKPSDSKPSKESCGVQKGGDSKVITKPKRSKGRQDTSNAADVIDLTGAELQRSMDKKPNKDFKPQSDFSASFPQQSMLKSKQAKSRQANARSNPSTPRIARKPKKADATDFPTPMIRKGQQQPPAMSVKAVPSELLSSGESELSDVPSDLPDSFPSTPPRASSSSTPLHDSSMPSFPHVPAGSDPATPVKRIDSNANTLTLTPKPLRIIQAPKISRFFPSTVTGPSSSCLPFQPISAPSFGLVQEQLAHDPFRLLIATIFLNRTRGHVALPVLFRVFDCYPSISAFAAADPIALTELIRCLGFQHQRAKKCITLAQTWLARPPARGSRYRKLHYPNPNDGRDVRRDECLDDEDERVAWEIAHLPGVGAYSLDSWRIFCRDELRGVNQEDGTFVPEWKKVLPKDKELRAYLTWMWLKEGYVWDWLTGKRTMASEKVMRAAEKGGIAREVDDGNWMLETSPVKKVFNGFTGDE